MNRIQDPIAIHSAELGYAPDGAYGQIDQEKGLNMKILYSGKAREACEHPMVRLHRDIGQGALYSSAAYIRGIRRNR